MTYTKIRHSVNYQIASLTKAALFWTDETRSHQMSASFIWRIFQIGNGSSLIRTKTASMKSYMAFPSYNHETKSNEHVDSKQAVQYRSEWKNPILYTVNENKNIFKNSLYGWNLKISCRKMNSSFARCSVINRLIAGKDNLLNCQNDSIWISASWHNCNLPPQDYFMMST